MRPAVEILLGRQGILTNAERSREGRMNQPRQGGCQCGTVRYEVAGDPLMVVVCHCSDCQRQSGSAFGMSFIVPRGSFRLLRGEVKTFTRKADSGRAATCTF